MTIIPASVPVPKKGPVDPLESLAAEADSFDKQADPAPGGEPGAAAPEPSISNAKVLLMAFEMIRETLCVIAGVKSPKTTCASDKLEPLAQAWADVCDKHGLDLSAMVGDWIVELKAVALTVPVIMAARAALSAEIDGMKAARDAKTVEAEPSRGA